MALDLNDPNGLVNLENLAREVENIAPDDRSVPIVFVPGFAGWGAPLFGAINYFGGEIDIATILANRGYTVIVASIAPISTNWERAYINYGNYFGPNRGPERTHTINRRRAILYSNSANFHNWTWDRDHKVHFVCHSQGGNTVRYLIDLMSDDHGYLHPEYFGQPERDDWAISVTTLGTPHRGTTIINVLESFVDRQLSAAVGLIARLFATASFYPPERRAFNLQLDHRGICRNTGETFQGMLERLESPDGPVWKWLYSKDNGFYDNSIQGVHELSEKTTSTSPNVFYFSLSFHATKAFPADWPPWSKDALKAFPFKTEIPIPFLRQLTDMAINGLWTFLPSIVDFPAFVQWVTQSVITRVLRVQGYNLMLPGPGEYIPREDVLPIMMPTVYAMGGQQLTQAQREILDPGYEDWLQNDGIVNTASMPGPRGSVQEVSYLPDVDFGTPGKRGTYWHLGVNDTMDHADEIGVFIERDTSVAMQNMYLDIANLICRLPALAAN
ncbi:lipase [Trichoderma velutinum]